MRLHDQVEEAAQHLEEPTQQGGRRAQQAHTPTEPPPTPLLPVSPDPDPHTVLRNEAPAKPTDKEGRKERLRELLKERGVHVAGGAKQEL